MRDHLTFALQHPREALRLYETAYHRMMLASIVDRIQERELRSRAASIASDVDSRV